MAATVGSSSSHCDIIMAEGLAAMEGLKLAFDLGCFDIVVEIRSCSPSYGGVCPLL